jgi:exodeoxyribonuclease-3
MPLRLLTLNVGAPAVSKAYKQLEWLDGRTEDVFVLTETSGGLGSQVLEDVFTAAEYFVIRPALDRHHSNDRGVMIVSKAEATADPVDGSMDFLPSRATGIVIETSGGPLRVLGAYVPQRDVSSQDKAKKRASKERKKLWLEKFSAVLGETASKIPAVLLGDFNLIAPPHRGSFQGFDYTFYGDLTQRHGFLDVFAYLNPAHDDEISVAGNNYGYRIDHAHASETLAPVLLGCEYIHETRTSSRSISDHSALTVHLDLSPTSLRNTQPIAAPSLF